jgi:ribose-phosphate pyrophosphokinase
MTMMAETNPALFRLFERVDGAPKPSNEGLAALLEDWQQKRANVTIPLMTAFADEQQEHRSQSYSLFEIVTDDARDYSLRHSNDALDAFLGTCQAGHRLKRVPERRAAARLRRVLDSVRASGEPLSAQFEFEEPVKRRSLMEILVAPLSNDGRTVAGFVCGLAGRPIKGESVTPLDRHMPIDDPLIFAFEPDRTFATAVVAHLGYVLSPLEEREFEDGENKARPLVAVRGRRVCVIASLNAGENQSVNDRLCRLLFLIGCLKTNGATKVTAVLPYLCYLRKDRQTKRWDPLTGRYVAQLIEAAGADALIIMEAHNLAAFQNAFRIPTIHLVPYPAFADYLLPSLAGRDVAVMSPDLGGSKRADLFRAILENKLGRPVGAALVEKHRSMGLISGEMFAGEVADRTVIILDDMISSGMTMARAVKACKERGAQDIYLAATHGLFSVDAGQHLGGGNIHEILIANTVHPSRVPDGLRSRVVTVDVADYLCWRNQIHIRHRCRCPQSSVSWPRLATQYGYEGERWRRVRCLSWDRSQRARQPTGALKQQRPAPWRQVGPALLNPKNGPFAAHSSCSVQ